MEADDTGVGKGEAGRELTDRQEKAAEKAKMWPRQGHQDRRQALKDKSLREKN